MISSEVQRTLVKSPPELWAEISDPEALARHLGEFGEIRITRVQPEQKVEWEAPDASGSIVIKPSGWGTKVKLTVTRELSEADSDPDGEAEAEPIAAEPVSAEPVAAERPNATIVAEDAADAPKPDGACEQPHAEPESDSLEQLALEDEPPPEREPEQRRGFFARLFGRRRAAQSDVVAPADARAAPIEPSADHGHEPPAQLEDDDTLDAETDLDAGRRAAPLTESASEPAELGQEDGESEHPATEETEETAATLAAELEQAEEVAEEQVTAVLTGVLDRLGAAHHRPFSRA